MRSSLPHGPNEHCDTVAMHAMACYDVQKSCKKKALKCSFGFKFLTAVKPQDSRMQVVLKHGFGGLPAPLVPTLP